MPTLEIQTDTITLYYREGASDKVYQCAIEPHLDRFHVTFAYGRRGATLDTGVKTPTPVDYDTARHIYDRLVNEKLAKGYSPGEQGVPYQHTERENQSTGILPQLLNPIEEEALDQYLEDPSFGMQEKFDGQRVLIRKEKDRITGINRQGLIIALPATLETEAQRLPGDFILDGEAMGNRFMAFDILALNGEDLRPLPYIQRWDGLGHILGVIHSKVIRWVDTTLGSTRKREVLQQLQQAHAEGVVFKHLQAPYVAGRPAQGGSQLKFKFYATLSAVVTGHQHQRSVELKLWQPAQGWIECGHVTIPVNQDIPAIGSVVEVRYLYAFKESGCLYQPVHLGVRTDIPPMTCTVAQLKYQNPQPVE